MNSEAIPGPAVRRLSLYLRQLENLRRSNRRRLPRVSGADRLVACVLRRLQSALGRRDLLRRLVLPSLRRFQLLFGTVPLLSGLAQRSLTLLLRGSRGRHFRCGFTGQAAKLLVGDRVLEARAATRSE